MKVTSPVNQDRYQKKILTIPNLLSLLRLAMIPLLVWLYVSQQKYGWTAFVLLLSGLTDIVDGQIARRCNMVSDFGKFLDPIADKLTQFVVVFCLACDYPLMIVVATIIFAKEILMLIGAVIFVKQGNETPYARWWGKLTTVVLYATMLLFILSSFLTVTLPDWVSVTAISLCIACLVFSFLNYALVFVEAKKNKSKSQANDAK